MKKLFIILIATLVSCQAKKESTTAASGSPSGMLDYLKEDSTIEFIAEFNCLILPPTEIYPDSIIDNTLPDILKSYLPTGSRKLPAYIAMLPATICARSFHCFSFNFQQIEKVGLMVVRCF